MIEYIILDQPASRIMRKAPQIVEDSDLWEGYLRDMRLLRGKIYIDEGLYAKRILSQDGQFKEPWDDESVHIVALDEGKIIGAVRITFLQRGETVRNAEISVSLKKLNLHRHIDAFNCLLSDLNQRGRKLSEVSRLIVQEEYRRYRDIHSEVSATLITMCYLYGLDNGVNDCFVIQGNKYKTSDIYARMGFIRIKDVKTDIDLVPFFDGDDICQLMHLRLEYPTLFFRKLMKTFKAEYDKAKIIKRR